MVSNSGLGNVFTAKKKKERDIGDVRSRTPSLYQALLALYLSSYIPNLLSTLISLLI
jgi:hypothetical protein